MSPRLKVVPGEVLAGWRVLGPSPRKRNGFVSWEVECTGCGRKAIRHGAGLRHLGKRRKAAYGCRECAGRATAAKRTKTIVAYRGHTGAISAVARAIGANPGVALARWHRRGERDLERVFKRGRLRKALPPDVDMTGRTVGGWVVVSRARNSRNKGNRNIRWNVTCAGCGTRRTMFAGDVRRASRTGRAGCAKCTNAARKPGPA